MNRRLRLRSSAAVLLAAGVVFAAAADAQGRAGQQGRLYRWVDQDGVVHYSDSVPPQFAETDRDILNKQGVAVGTEEGAVTPEERAAMERQASETAERRRHQQEAARHDNMLLETYLTVEDIEDLRDRRLELLESQIKVTELYLANLRKRLATLQVEASNYAPHSERENAPHLPDDLALEISRTTSSIHLYEQRLTRTRSDQDEVRASFNRDIVRFKELKGG